MCEEGAKKIAEVVEHFSVEFQKDHDVLDTLSCITQLDSQADKVTASRHTNTITCTVGNTRCRVLNICSLMHIMQSVASFGVAVYVSFSQK